MSMTMDAAAPGGNTLVSPVGGPAGGPVASAAPGAQGPGGQMQMTTAVLWLIGGFAAIVIGAGIVFRKGQKLPPLRVDAVSALVNASEVAVILGTFKVLAYRWHGHKLAQAYLVLF